MENPQTASPLLEDSSAVAGILTDNPSPATRDTSAIGANSDHVTNDINSDSSSHLGELSGNTRD